MFFSLADISTFSFYFGVRLGIRCEDQECHDDRKEGGTLSCIRIKHGHELISIQALTVSLSVSFAGLVMKLT